MLCMKIALRLIHENSFKDLKYPKNEFIVLIAVNPKDGVTNMPQISPTLIIKVNVLPDLGYSGSYSVILTIKLLYKTSSELALALGSL